MRVGRLFLKLPRRMLLDEKGPGLKPEEREPRALYFRKYIARKFQLKREENPPGELSEEEEGELEHLFSSARNTTF